MGSVEKGSSCGAEEEETVVVGQNNKATVAETDWVTGEQVQGAGGFDSARGEQNQVGDGVDSVGVTVTKKELTHIRVRRDVDINGSRLAVGHRAYKRGRDEDERSNLVDEEGGGRKV